MQFRYIRSQHGIEINCNLAKKRMVSSQHVVIIVFFSRPYVCGIIIEQVLKYHKFAKVIFPFNNPFAKY